ncbi:MAG: GNAT family N-acetyltransferase [Bacillota bacterium]
MIRILDLKDEVVAREVLELQREAYRVEADLIGYDRIPPLVETLEQLKVCKEFFYGYFEENALAGIVSFMIEDNTLDIYRVAIKPQYFSKGIATKLIRYLETLDGISRMIVSTGKLNRPATNLYSKLGFCKTGSFIVEESLEIISFEKILT